MARSRNIKPAIMDNEKLAELDPLARLLFVYLWMLADREGRLEDRPKRIAAQALPYDRTADVGAMLDDLQSAGFILRYVAHGVACIQILAFKKHQTPHVRETASTLPEHEADTAEKGHGNNLGGDCAQPRHDLGDAETSPRSPDSGFLIPDCGLRNEDMQAQAPATPAPSAPSPKPAKRATQIPGDFYPNETGVAYADERRVSMAVELRSFCNHHQAKGTTMKDWQAAWRTWCDKAVEFGRAGKAATTQALSFAERDEQARHRRWEEMTGRKWPTDGVVDHAEIFDVVDATTTREIGHEPANQSH